MKEKVTPKELLIMAAILRLPKERAPWRVGFALSFGHLRSKTTDQTPFVNLTLPNIKPKEGRMAMPLTLLVSKERLTLYEGLYRIYNLLLINPLKLIT